VARPARDEVEFVLLRAALDADLPVLAICRGMQLLAVASGGRLFQHLPDVLGHERHRNGVTYGTHDVHFAPGSRAAAILGESRPVNSWHHQGVSDAGTLVATGWATGDKTPDGDELIEAVEDPAKRFVLGVQWHPEEMEDKSLFRAVVDAAR
jgi:putative glutamine amidotransferase